MNMHEKYLEALKLTDGWVKVSEWAIKVGERFPEVLEKAEKEAVNQANETTGLREIAARISSRISRGEYAEKIEIDTGEKRGWFDMWNLRNRLRMKKRRYRMTSLR